MRIRGLSYGFAKVSHHVLPSKAFIFSIIYSGADLPISDVSIESVLNVLVLYIACIDELTIHEIGHIYTIILLTGEVIRHQSNVNEVPTERIRNKDNDTLWRLPTRWLSYIDIETMQSSQSASGLAIMHCASEAIGTRHISALKRRDNKNMLL